MAEVRRPPGLSGAGALVPLSDRELARYEREEWWAPDSLTARIVVRMRAEAAAARRLRSAAQQAKRLLEPAAGIRPADAHRVLERALGERPRG